MASKRIAQVLDVLRGIREGNPQSLEDVERLRLATAKRIAEADGITSNTVEDKCRRQLRRDPGERFLISDFDRLVLSWIQGADPALLDRLRSRVTQSHRDEDIAAIDAFRGPQSQPPAPPRSMRYWLFQCNPARYDLESKIETLGEETWGVKRFKHEIAKGDQVFLWMTGAEGGVRAVATVIDGPSSEIVSDEGEEAGGPQTNFAVRIRIDRRLSVPRAVAQANTTLATLDNLRFQRATIYRVSEEQAQALFALASPLKATFDLLSATSGLIASLESDGWVFEPWQLAAFITAVRTKPFVIIAGVSGTGKSALPRLIARRTGAEFLRIPVRPDWTDSSEVLGYVNLQNRFQPGSLARLIRAASDSGKFHVALIDEMNLARVEQYFAEVLSAIEQPDDPRLLSIDMPPGDVEWTDLRLPSNVALVGTVNMDESTHGFSRKVLDRAFTLELSQVDLEAMPRATVAAGTRWPAEAWLAGARRPHDLAEAPDFAPVIRTLVAANEILAEAQLQIGYRSRDEILLFVHRAKELEVLFRTRSGQPVAPLDLALQMKLLPRISGGSMAVRRVIWRLLTWAITGKASADENEVTHIVERWTSEGRKDSIASAKLPRTAARLALMAERLELDGFATFWV